MAEPEPDPPRQPSAGHPGFTATVTALAIAQILAWAALYYAFSSFVLPMMRETGWSKSEAMTAFTIGLATSGLCSYHVGDWIDRGLGRWVMCGGSLLAGLGLLAWSQASSLPALYATWALLGATMACTLYEPAFSVLTKRYPTQYLRGITALTLVAGFASTLSFPACALLTETLGWRQGVVVIAAVMLGIVLPLNAWALRGPMVVASPATAQPQADAKLHEALRHRSFWLLTFAFTGFAFAGAGLWAHVIPAFEAKFGPDLGPAEAVAIVVWIGPAQVAGRFLYAWLGRGLALRRMGVTVMLAMPCALVLFALSASRAALLLFALLFGLANGLVTIVRSGLVPQYWGRAHVGRIGGVMNMVTLLARATAPLGCALLLALVGTYADLWLWLAGLGLLALLAFALARQPG